MVKETTQALTDGGLARSSFAVHPDVLNGLAPLNKVLGLRSTAQLLTMLVRHQDQVVPALAPIVAAFKVKQAEGMGDKDRRRELKRKMDQLSPEALAKIAEIAAADAVKAPAAQE